MIETYSSPDYVAAFRISGTPTAEDYGSVIARRRRQAFPAFPREAVISDKSWVHALARITGPLAPHVEVRAFGSQEREAAMAWVAELPRGT
jgi:hypothetical protein